MNQNANNNQPSILEIAWQRQAELSFNATNAQRLHLSLRLWVLVLSVTATLLAILTELAGGAFPRAPIIPQLLRVGLILAPIAGSVVLTFANKFQQGERWLALRAGAEELKKEIYLYRTLLQQHPDRRQWLDERLAAIQRQVFEAVGGDLALKPYNGPVLPTAAGDNSLSDPGLSDLLPDDYLRYRLDEQLDWHSRKIVPLQQGRTRLQVLIFAFGGLGAFLAALGGVFNIWVALTASIAAALTAWLELRRIDSVINNYSQLILELKIIKDHWLSLSPEERTGDEFFKLVIAAERVLWSQHNQYVSEMRKAVAELRGESADALAELEKMPAQTAIDSAIMEQEQIKKETTPQAAAPAGETAGGQAVSAKTKAAPALETRRERTAPVRKAKKGAPHAFVVMPFGRKQGADGRWIDFNNIYEQLIKPALIEAGFEPFRADEESISGDILTDMFQELLLADLVIADLSIDNANVFYELGVRHAMRKRGVVHIQAGRAYMPFDIFNVRTIPYQCDKTGKPDPKHMDKDKQAIVKVLRETWASDRDRVHSPIFNLLDGLTEPDRKSLRTPLATGYWREYQECGERIDLARRQKRVGDILLLTEEVHNPLIQEEVIAEAGQALESMEYYALALQQYQRGLEINPRNAEFWRKEAFHLGRLNRTDEAIMKLERLLHENPTDSEAIAFLGRIYKDMFVNEWYGLKHEQARLKAAYQASYLLKKSIDTYLVGYSLEQNHYYSGINALTLSLILDHLVQQAGQADEPDPEIETVRRRLPSLAGAVQFTLEQEAKNNSHDFWVFASLGDLAVNTAKDPTLVGRAYRKAVALGGRDKFALQSILNQLKLLNSLGFRPEYVKAGMDILEEALAKLSEPTEAEQTDARGQEPAQVFLFSGHMLDRPDRRKARFPVGMIDEARQKIGRALDKLKADPNDLAISAGAACGGDILFIEACLERKLKVEVYLPFDEAKFIEGSVSFAGDEWVERFYQIRQSPDVTFSLQLDRVGPVPPGDDPFERNNRWALYSALGYGIERLRLIALWNGQRGDGPGGTGNMVETMHRLGGIVEHLDTTKFDYWKAKGKVGQVLDKLVKGE